MKKLNAVGQYVEINGKWFRIKGGELIPIDGEPSKEARIGYVSKGDGTEIEEGELEALLNDGVVLETQRPDGAMLYVSEVRGEIGLLWIAERFGGEERAVYYSIDNLESLKRNIDNLNILKALKILFDINYIKSGEWENSVVEYRGVIYKLGYKFSGDRVYTSIRKLKIKENKNVSVKNNIKDKIYSRMKAIDL